MKKIIFLLFFLPFHLYALELQIIGPCPLTGNVSEKIKGDPKESVGDFTVKSFKHLNIPFTGSPSGIISIFQTPSGKEAVEKIGPNKARFFGWCYRVNGFEPAVTSDQYFFESKDDKLVWIYGYSTYDDGEWIGYCDPAHLIVDSSRLLQKYCASDL